MKLPVIIFTSVISDLSISSIFNRNIWMCSMYYMSRDARKPVFGVSNQVRHKPGSAAAEDG